VAVIFLILRRDSSAQLFLNEHDFPLDKGQKQLMMWPKVGQSGQQ